MADKGAIAEFSGGHMPKIVAPRSRTAFGSLSITGQARLDEVPAAATVMVFDARMLRLMSVQSLSDGSFSAYNLRAGRYFLLITGDQTYLPAAYAVDVS